MDKLLEAGRCYDVLTPEGRRVAVVQSGHDILAKNFHQLIKFRWIWDRHLTGTTGYQRSENGITTFFHKDMPLLQFCPRRWKVQDVLGSM